jgi:D-arabinitol dehydrogenase (NADP+)
VKAAFYDARREVAVRDLVDEPKLDATDVLIRVRACGICGTDFHIYEGDVGGPLPLIGGHELAGEIIGLGSAVVPELRVGERVAVDPNISCGTCVYCQRGQVNHCLRWQAIGVTRDGGFADYVRAPQSNVYPIGDLDYELAAFIEPLSCVVYGVERVGISVGATALIYGAGPIGLLMLQTVARGGASSITVVDLDEGKLELARSLGAHEVLSAGPAIDDRLRRVAPLGFDVVIDCTGVPAVVEGMFAHARSGGKLLLFGVNPRKARVSMSPYEVYRRDLEILSSFALRYTFGDAYALIASGAIDVRLLLSHRFPIESFAEAFQLARSGRALKVQIQPR